MHAGVSRGRRCAHYLPELLAPTSISILFASTGLALTPAARQWIQLWIQDPKKQAPDNIMRRKSKARVLSDGGACHSQAIGLLPGTVTHQAAQHTSRPLACVSFASVFFRIMPRQGYSPRKQTPLGASNHMQQFCTMCLCRHRWQALLLPSRCQAKHRILLRTRWHKHRAAKGLKTPTRRGAAGPSDAHMSRARCMHGPPSIQHPAARCCPLDAAMRVLWEYAIWPSANPPCRLFGAQRAAPGCMNAPNSKRGCPAPDNAPIPSHRRLHQHRRCGAGHADGAPRHGRPAGSLRGLNIRQQLRVDHEELAAQVQRAQAGEQGAVALGLAGACAAGRRLGFRV